MNINTSAKLKEYGFLIPQQVTFTKSATAPYKSLSIALPNAPPITKEASICIKNLVEFLNQTKNTTDIIIEIAVKMYAWTVLSPSKRPKFIPLFQAM